MFIFLISLFFIPFFSSFAIPCIPSPGVECPNYEDLTLIDAKDAKMFLVASIIFFSVSLILYVVAIISKRYTESKSRISLKKTLLFVALLTNTLLFVTNFANKGLYDCINNQPFLIWGLVCMLFASFFFSLWQTLVFSMNKNSKLIQVLIIILIISNFAVAYWNIMMVLFSFEDIIRFFEFIECLAVPDTTI